MRDPRLADDDLRSDRQYNDEHVAIWRQRYGCQHDNSEIVWRHTSNGTRQLRRQCKTCGECHGSALKHELATPDTPRADPLLPKQWEQHWDTKLEEARQRLAQRNNDWWSWYNAYLESSDWEYKRRRVMQRANGICEGCRDNAASQVHHLTYAHVGNEFLFELVAICTECHERFHNGGAA